jgi:VIT1/CCC1 family predicted Fe2+/Mn2+ transporter
MQSILLNRGTPLTQPSDSGSEQSGIGRRLVLDELFDLSLYRELRSVGGPELRSTLEELIRVEERHLAFWREFFKIRVSALDWKRRLKLRMIVAASKLLGAPVVDLVLEAIEVYGVRKYLSLWNMYKDRPMGNALRGILEDEFKHEDMLVTRLEGKIINPDRIRNLFLGLNDGMVEILGAVSGFFASFGQNNLVLIAGLTTAVAGSLSMAAGAFAAISSENEMRRTQEAKALFLGTQDRAYRPESAIASAGLVGFSYFIGAVFPLLPVLLGATSPLPSILTGGTMVLLVSATLAFLSGMQIRKRAAINLVLVAIAAATTYLIGILVRSLVGIEI